MSSQVSTPNPFVIAARWVAFIPAGFAAAAICGVLAAIVIGNIWWIPRSDLGFNMMMILVAGGIGAVAVAAGSGVAPTKRKKVPSIVMASLVVILCVPDVLIFINDGHLMLAITRVVCIAAAIATATMISREDTPVHQEWLGVEQPPTPAYGTERRRDNRRSRVEIEDHTSTADRAYSPIDAVLYLDTDSNRIIQMPASELRPGCVRVRMEGVDGTVWVSGEHVKPGPVRHPPFDECRRTRIRFIQETFAEHDEMPLDEWEIGFRRDLHPDHEIELWHRAANVYRKHAAHRSAVERDDIYGVLVACMTSSPETVWHVIKVAGITKSEVADIVNNYFRRAA